MKQYKNLELETDLKEGILNYTELSKKYFVSRPTVRAYAKRLSIHKGNKKRLKTHTLDLNYFKKIDTQEKAYVLGFIYADGCNTRKGLSIGIDEIDKDVLLFIKDQLKISDALRYIKAHKKNWCNMYELRCSSMELSRQLTELGCPPAKSLILKFPKFIPSKLISHFIRGYFDGDGSIYYNKKTGKSWHLGFTCGSHDFLLNLQSILFDTTGAVGKIYQLKTGYSLIYSKLKEVNHVISYIYKDASFSMQRKKEKHVLFVNTYSNCFINYQAGRSFTFL